MKQKVELCLTGSGGQGIILGSIILGEAAIMNHKKAVQSQSYGPEARGGSSKAEVIISDDEIDYPKVQNTNLLLALTQEALDKYADETNEDTVLLVDSSLRVPENIPAHKVVSIPILDTANKVIGKPYVANIISVGAINAIMKLVSDKILENVVLHRVPKDTCEVNLRSLHEGYKLVESMKKNNDIEWVRAETTLS